jgi:hypothetical protein
MIKHVFGPFLECFQSAEVHDPIAIIQCFGFKHETDANAITVQQAAMAVGATPLTETT